MSFQFKQFSIKDKNSAMKVGTDAVLLGCSADVNNANRILDIGTGCGVIALMLAQRSNAHITGIDMHKPSIADAKLNFSNSNWNNRLKALHLSLQEFSKNCEIKFDLIVSNPPFFSNSLLSPSDEKSLAKHNHELPYSELLKNAYQLLQNEGKFTVIIPVSEYSNFNFEATRTGFYTLEKLNIIPAENKAANRIIVTLSKQAGSIQTIRKLSIRNKRNEFSRDYKNLTKDFYLDF
jgi:tRNA1Val (adenine37-N6)-methyltransferase